VAAVLAPTYAERVLWQVQVPPEPADAGALPDRCDAVVIGAGYCGLAAATELAARGSDVVVVDREPLGWGASTRNGGMVIPELKAGPADLERAHGPLGRRMYAEVNDAFDWLETLIGVQAPGDAGIDCDYRRSGQLYLAHAARLVPGLRAMVDDHAARGEPVRFIEREALTEEIGSSAFFGAIVLERTGGLHPAKLHAGLVRRARGAGASIHDRTAATSISPGARGRFTVGTTRGSVRTGAVIVATNAYADGLLPQLARRVLPVGSYIIATEVLDADLARSVIPRGRMVVDTKNFLFYWRLTPDGRVAFGGRRSLDPVDIPEARDFLYDAMLRIHPQLTGTAVEYAWGGSVGLTLDRLPHVGTIDGAWYATGCNGSGVALNTWLGHRLGLTVSGEASPPSFHELRHRPIPLSSWKGVYLPFVSRWFSWKDRS
jgi:glycine/D-amino acid oxidase-like deaminating enzyme